MSQTARVVVTRKIGIYKIKHGVPGTALELCEIKDVWKDEMNKQLENIKSLIKV